MRDQNKHFAEVSAGLESKAEAGVREAQHQFAQTCAQMDMKLVEWTKEADARMDDTTKVLTDHHRHFTAVCTKLDMQLGEETEVLKGHLITAQEQFQGSMTQVDRRIAQSEADSEARCGELDVAIASQEGKLADAVGKMDRVVSEQMAALEEKVAHEHAHFEEINVALDRKLGDRLDMQDGRMDESSSTVSTSHPIPTTA